MTKITPTQIQEARDRFSKGEKVYEIAKELNFSPATIYYWVDENNNQVKKERAKRTYHNLSKNKKKELFKKKKSYLREYMKKKYNENIEYREKYKERIRKWKQQNPDKVKEYRKKNEKK